MSLIKCTECGAEISNNAERCPKCGAPVEKKIVCTECGTELSAKMRICPKCGAPVASAGVSNKTTKNVLTAEEKTTSTKLIILTVISLAFCLLSNILLVHVRTGFFIGGLASFIITCILCSNVSEQWGKCTTTNIKIWVALASCAAFLTYSIIYIIKGVKILNELIDSIEEYYNMPGIYWCSTILLLILCVTYLVGIYRSGMKAYNIWENNVINEK